jgi:hypothetical protein
VSRPWKIALGLGGAILALNVLLIAVNSVTGGTPGGPTSSSYATGGDGLAAYAELIADAGHPVARRREPPHERPLGADETAVLLDPGFVDSDDAAALRRFVRAGGRLVIGGEEAAWVGRIVGPGIDWTSERLEDGRVAAPVAEVAAVERVSGLRGGRWRETGAALPAYAGSGGALLAVGQVGGGRVVLLADAAPIQNDALDEADNAALGLGLAGEDTRPVVFLESFHGYGPASGFGAIPTEWWVLFGVAALAAGVFMLARGRRLGPAEQEAREFPPARREYVDSLGGVLARTRGRAETAEALQAEARRLVASRLGLAEGEDVVAAARRLGFADGEASALVRPATTDADLLETGQAFASLMRSQGSAAWKS